MLQDADHIVENEDGEYEFFNRELYYSSKKGKGKAGKKGSSSSKSKGKGGKGKAGGKRRDLEIIGQDADFFELDKDAEYQFFDRELYSSSKKGKGKAGKKGSSKSKSKGKGGKGKAGGKRQ